MGTEKTTQNHIWKTAQRIKDSIKTIIDEIINLAKYQDQVTRETMPASKILFAMSGTGDVKKVSENIKAIK